VSPGGDVKDLGWSVYEDHVTDSDAAMVVGCSLLGSVFLFMRISVATFNLLSVLQGVLEKLHATRPLLGSYWIFIFLTTAGS
jgi:hypothetical protein